MRMHPRLKARRGRFGAGGLSAPVLIVTSPEEGKLLRAGGSPPATFTGTAADDLDGDISANIIWSVTTGSPTNGFGSPADATGASVDLSGLLTVGSPAVSNTVIARVSDSGGKVSSVTRTVTFGD